MRKFVLPTLVIAAAGALLSPLGEHAGAYTIQGGQLPLGQRDFRICNNFADTEGVISTLWRGPSAVAWVMCKIGVRTTPARNSDSCQAKILCPER